MDHGERLAKVETAVDEHQERMERIERDIGRIYTSIDALRDHTDRALAELRDHTDRGLAELRERTDRGLAELRDHTDQGFSELRAAIEEVRKEHARTSRWMIGIAFAYGMAIAGMVGRIGGLY
jgi:ElaB/YqjD/DUF883 family membrane-anchored ribosome-binding protein